jgi:hypothetical protein
VQVAAGDRNPWKPTHTLPLSLLPAPEGRRTEKSIEHVSSLTLGGYAARVRQRLAKFVERKLTAFRCPGCGYDVRQTLADRRSICPECGENLHWDICAQDYRFAERVRLLAWALWLAPPGIVAVAALLGGPDLFWFAIAACALAIFLAMLWIEVHHGQRGLMSRALGMTVAVMLLDGVTGVAVALIVLAVRSLA